MSAVSDPTDATLLGRLQEAVPFCPRPFDALGEACGISGGEALERVRRLKEERVIRQIGPIFDTRSLGYASSLVAARISPERLDEAAEIINAHPGVSHNYRRNHDFNLWYTVAVAPNSRLGLEKTVEVLHQRSGAASTRLLPTLELFKIGVRLDVEGAAKPDARSAPAYSEKNRKASGPLTAEEIRFVQVMQRDLALTPEPFAGPAEELGMSFDQMKEFLANGRMRRFAAVLHHRKAGFRANAMGVWAAPEGDEAEMARIGAVMAGFRAVSHCYRRPTYPDWPYNYFTMVHGKTVEECHRILGSIGEATGLSDYQALFSSKEYKKVRVRYFTEEEAAWEAGV